MSIACSRKEKTPVEDFCAVTKYIVLDPVSITGVEVRPLAGLGFPPGCGTSPGCSSEVFHNGLRSEEHTSELQSHSFISYAVFCLKKNDFRIPPRCTFTSLVSLINSTRAALC